MKFKKNVIIALLLIAGEAGWVILFFPINQFIAVFGLVLISIFQIFLLQRELDRNKKEISYNSSLDQAFLDPTFKIANETLPYLRQGLNEETAVKAAEIIQKIAEVPAVVITDQEKVLGCVGINCPYHQVGGPILREATLEVLKTGELKVVHSTKELGCRANNPDCFLEAAVVVPLKLKGKTIGTLKLYEHSPNKIEAQLIRLATGLGQLLSMQVELSEINRQEQLLTLARLDALNAQINPHFLFNTLNTIINCSRTNPERARRLLIHLSEFFRKSMKPKKHFVTLEEEMDFVHTYLILEKARFGHNLQITQEIDQDLLQAQIPALSIQPLVENAIKHGLTPKEGIKSLKLSATTEDKDMVIEVSDNGVGIPQELLGKILKPGYGSGNGVGLSNVNQRLIGFYGKEYALKVESHLKEGTTITIRVPLSGSKVIPLIKEESEFEVESFDY